MLAGMATPLASFQWCTVHITVDIPNPRYHCKMGPKMLGNFWACLGVQDTLSARLCLCESSQANGAFRCLSKQQWKHAIEHACCLQVRDLSAFLVDRYSERKEKREKGRLLSQAEKEAARLTLAQAAAAAATAATAVADTQPLAAESAAASVPAE